MHLYECDACIGCCRSPGTRHPVKYNRLSMPVIEMTVYGTEGLIETEGLYEGALEALYGAVSDQTIVEGVSGYLHSIKEAQGATQLESPFPDTFCVQGRIGLGLRSP